MQPICTLLNLGLNGILSCNSLTHLKKPWCWERLKVGGKGDDRGWDGWMASPVQWTWVWVWGSGSWWWTGKPDGLQSMESQRVRHNWATELNFGPHGLQHTKLLCPSLSPRVCSNSCYLNQWYYLTISSSVTPLFLAFRLSQHEGLFQQVGSLHQVAKILELQLQHQSFQWILGLISFRVDWFDLRAVQGTLKSPLKYMVYKYFLPILAYLFFLLTGCISFLWLR